MKCTPLIASLVAAMAVAEPNTDYYLLSIESSNPKLSGLGLGQADQRKGAKVIEVGGQPRLYETENGALVSSSAWALNVINNTLVERMMGWSGPRPFARDGYLSYNGSNDVFYVCEPAPETVPPGDLPVYQILRGIGVFSPGETVPSQCEHVKVKAVPTTEPTFSTGETTSTPTAPNYSAEPWPTSLDSSNVAPSNAPSSDTATVEIGDATGASSSRSHQPFNHTSAAETATGPSEATVTSVVVTPSTSAASIVSVTNAAAPNSASNTVVVASTANTVTVENCDCTSPGVASSTSEPSAIPLANGALPLTGSGLVALIAALALVA